MPTQYIFLVNKPIKAKKRRATTIIPILIKQIKTRRDSKAANLSRSRTRAANDNKDKQFINTITIKDNSRPLPNISALEQQLDSIKKEVKLEVYAKSRSLSKPRSPAKLRSPTKLRSPSKIQASLSKLSSSSKIETSSKKILLKEKLRYIPIRTKGR